MLSGFAVSGTVVHRVAFWEDTGLSPAVLAAGIAADPLTVVVASLGWGWAQSGCPRACSAWSPAAGSRCRWCR